MCLSVGVNISVTVRGTVSLEPRRGIPGLQHVLYMDGVKLFCLILIF